MFTGLCSPNDRINVGPKPASGSKSGTPITVTVTPELWLRAHAVGGGEGTKPCVSPKEGPQRSIVREIRDNSVNLCTARLYVLAFQARLVAFENVVYPILFIRNSFCSASRKGHSPEAEPLLLGNSGGRPRFAGTPPLLQAVLLPVRPLFLARRGRGQLSGGGR